MKTRCLGCMEEYDNSFGLCPKCGYEPDTDVDSPIHMRPGVLLHGRYLIGRVLGSGGFGVTYIGWDFTLQQKVAIKEYLPSEFATRVIGQTQVSVFGGRKEEQFGDGMDQFVEEARRLAQFQNEDGIVRIFDSFAENNTAYIVMEYLEGETLTTYLERNGKVPVDEAIKMLAPVLESLEVVHKAGIIHRDIAPDNIFLTKDGRVKLIDFGAARYATTSHSRSLTVIIKPGYSPEEQYRSRGDQGPHTDVYALGAVLYRMITGIVLPDSMERRACFEKNGKDIVVPVSKNCKISKSQENAIMNALNVRVEDRTPTASQFLEDLTAKKTVKRIFGKIKVTDLMRWPLWAKILIPTATAVVVALLALLFTGVIGPNGNLITDLSLGENEARVPAIVGFSSDMAQDRLVAQGLECKIVGTQYSEEMPANTITYQSITAGQIVEKDTVVEVYITTNVSPEAEEGVMPGVAYMMAPEAVDLLEAQGLKVKTEEVFDDVVAEGMVISQKPEAGTAVKEGDVVTLEVSKGVDPDKAEASTTVVTLRKNKYKLYVGESVSLIAEGGDGTYTYASSNEGVVTVNRNGELKAVGAGKATITVNSGEAEAATCTIVVNDYKMALSRSSLTLFVDGSASLSVSGIPSSAEVTWSSANSSVASVNKNGKVTGKATGSTKVTATWKNGNNTYSASASVKVESEGITLNTYKLGSLYVGDTYTLKANTSSKESVKWKSSDKSVATVSSSGVVTAVGGGSATITATCGSHSEKCSVTVTKPKVSLNKSSVSLYIGDTSKLSASVTPNGTSVSWSSDDSSIAQVSGGKITAVGSGTTVIRVKITYAGKTYKDSCEVTVSKPSVKLSTGELSLLPGDSATLKATVKPSGCDVSWSTSDSGVATVSGGKVKAVDYGTAKITAKITYNGKSYSKSCTVTVSKPTISVTASDSTIEYSQRDTGTCKLTAKVTPDGDEIKWKSSDESVATVSGKGKKATVTAVSEGSVTITATYTVNGTTVKDKCEITVKKAASKARLDNFEYNTYTNIDDFWVTGTMSSNYAITKMTCKGTAKSNALNISVSDTADPFYFPDNTFEYDVSNLTSYFISQYRSLYDLYADLAGLVNADNSVTMVVTFTAYDASGYNESRTMTLTVYR